MAIFEIHFTAANEHLLDLGAGLQGIAVCENEIGPFSFSMEPILSSTPQMRAALMVTAFKASCCGSPNAAALAA